MSVWRHELDGELLYAFRDDVDGSACCFRCGQQLSEDEEDKLQVGRVGVDPVGRWIVVCPGCLTGSEQ